MPWTWSISTWIRAFIRGKNKVAWNEKWKITMWFFVFQKYGKFWSVLRELFIKHKPLISDECWCVNMNPHVFTYLPTKIMTILVRVVTCFNASSGSRNFGPSVVRQVWDFTNQFLSRSFSRFTLLSILYLKRDY